MTRSSPCALAALTVAVFLANPSPVHAARLPDWAREIAEAAPPLPEGTSALPTRVLSEEVRVSVGEDGETTTRWRQATQILSSQVSRLRHQSFVFREGARLRVWRGWHLPLGDKAQRAYQEPLELAVGDTFLSDRKARFVSVAGVSRGSIVFFESEVVDTPIDLSWRNLFGNEAETLRERFEVETPAPGWTVRSAWLRQTGPAASAEGNTWRWEMRNIPAAEDEPLGVPAEDTAPLLVVSLSPPPGAKVEPLAFRDWVSFSSWWEGVAKGRDAVTPEIEAAARKALAAAPGKRFSETVEALARFVRDDVRYVAKEVGVENYQPRPAGQVLGQLYGDCKDKATLLRSLLKAAGVVSYHVHVNATQPDTLSEEIPNWGFDHAILAVCVPAGAEIGSSFAPALVEAGELGRLLIVDATDEYAAIGTIPPYLAGRKGLVMAGPKAGLITLPSGDASQNRVERKFVTELHPDSSLGIETVWRFTGAPAEWARRAHARSYADRRKEAEEQLFAVFVDGEPKSYTVEEETADGAYLERMSWRVPPPPHGGLKDVPLFAGAADSMARTNVGSKRKTAVRYQNPVTFVYETTLKGVPAAAVLPGSEKREGEGWSIASTCERDGDVVRARWQAVVSRNRYEVVALAELKKLWQAIGATGRAAVVLGETPSR